MTCDVSTLLTGASCVRTDPAWRRVLSPNLPGDLSLRLSRARPGDFSLSSGLAGDLSRRNSVRPSRYRWGVLGSRCRPSWLPGPEDSRLEMCSV